MLPYIPYIYSSIPKTMLLTTPEQHKVQETCNKDGQEQKIELPETYKQPLNKETRKELEKEYEKQIQQIGKYVYIAKYGPYDTGVCANKETCLQKADEIYNKLEPIVKKFYTPEKLAYNFYEKVARAYTSPTIPTRENYERSIEERKKESKCRSPSIRTTIPKPTRRPFSYICPYLI
jgi:hypothetical protein